MLINIKPRGPEPRLRRVPVPRNQAFPRGVRVRHDIERAAWRWPQHPVSTVPGFARFRLPVAADGTPLRFQVSADQFFFLYLDGHWVARGPDAGPPWYYSFAEYEVDLPAGEHVIEAFVWWLGDHAPEARMTAGPGFALAGVDAWHERLTTGVAPGRAAPVKGYRTEPETGQGGAFGVGKQHDVVQGSVAGDLGVDRMRRRMKEDGVRSVVRDDVPALLVFPESHGEVREEGSSHARRRHPAG